MRPPLVACVLLAVVVAAAVAPPAGAVCVPRNPKATGKPGSPGVPVPAPPKLTPPKPAPGPPKPTPTPTPAAPIVPGGDIVKALCAKTDYPVVCQMTVVPPPGAAQKLDAAGVLRLAMGAVRAKAADAKKAAAALVADPKTTPLAKGALGDCVESYDDIAYSLDQADKAMAAGDKDTTGTMLDTVRTDVDTCDQGFEDREELTPVMAKQDAELAKLSSNCIAIAAAAGLR
ncbi:hypothetical protein E2562_003962 [Oryza meyeriana var. granulata]|uniref:Pectinesterase inhibitor domain-containing protein n=1 Tax=Oryza meyeriana var. granulata TaxID=110450 RepID=A0A6G1BHB8_9ORYZ|nr:hypothetical protein E2562_003962 [Oryza meyeriana var. granulata]